MDRELKNCRVCVTAYFLMAKIALICSTRREFEREEEKLCVELSDTPARLRPERCC